MHNKFVLILFLIEGVSSASARMTYQTHHLVQSIYSFIRQSLERCSALHCLDIKQNAKPAFLCRSSETSPKDFDQTKEDEAGTLPLFFPECCPHPGLTKPLCGRVKLERGELSGSPVLHLPCSSCSLLHRP